MSKTNLKYWGILLCAIIIVASGAILPAVADPLEAEAPLRGAYSGTCVSDALCTLSYAAPEVETVAVPEEVVPLGPGAFGQRIFTGPGDPTGPATNVDWSLSLRGAYENNNSGDQFEVLANPSVSVTHSTRRAEYVLGADAELVSSTGGDYRLSEGTLSFESSHTLSRRTLVTTSATITGAQASANDPDLATGVSRAPIVVNGSLGAGFERKSGRFTVALRGSVEREIYGDSTLGNGTLQDNAERNRIGIESGLRVSRQLNGVLGVFVDGAVRRDIYDLPASGSGVSQNSSTYAIRGGLSGNWSERFIVEASAGYAYRQFDRAAVMGSVPVVLADFTMTYRPTRTLELRAGIATNISTPDSTTASSTRIDYDAFLDAAYQVNQRFALRASIAGNWSRFAQTNENRLGYSAGLGVDYTLTPRTSLSADYTYAVRDITTNGSDISHRVVAGVTYSR